MVNEIIKLRAKVTELLHLVDYHPFLSVQLLSASPSLIDTAELRAWLFEVYTIC